LGDEFGLQLSVTNDGRMVFEIPSEED
jgi:hypothetical protein